MKRQQPDLTPEQLAAADWWQTHVQRRRPQTGTPSGAGLPPAAAPSSRRALIHAIREACRDASGAVSEARVRALMKEVFRQ
ncbi:MAG: hypothetical protein OHK0046_46430 [Anaerolineae bacterium]